MAKYFVEDTSLTAIADAIREKTGTTAAMTLDEMPIAISGIDAGGGCGGDTGWVVCEETEPTKATTIEKLQGLRLSLPKAESIGDTAFYNCNNLTSVDLPVATSIGDSAFQSCNNLTSVDLPSATSIGDTAFNGCTNLTSVDLPVATSIGDQAFEGCTSLTSVDLPVATSINNYAFQSCNNLSTLILRNTEEVCQLIVTAVLGTKIATSEGAPAGEGFIYVPSALYEGYVTLIAQQTAMLLMSQGMGEAEAQATADYIARAVLRKIEDYPEICGAT